MLQKIKGFVSKKGKRLLLAFMASAMTVMSLAVSAFASSSESGTSGGNSMSAVVSSAGDSLAAEFGNLVTAVVPVLVGIAMVGLGMFAVIYLFKMAKKLFTKAAE